MEVIPMELQSTSIFANHPEMILGEMKEVSGPYGMETTCAPMEGADRELQLQEAVKHIKGSMVLAVDWKQNWMRCQRVFQQIQMSEITAIRW